MVCSKCKTDNKPEAKFCKKCGQKLNLSDRRPKRCPRGHIMEPSWNNCRICDSGRGVVGKPAIEPLRTIIEENPASNTQMRQAAVNNDSEGASRYSLSLNDAGRATSQDPSRTMILDDNGACAQSPPVDDRKLTGFLVSFSRTPQGEYFALYNTARYTIGRARKADISFTQDSLMSESHALLRFTGDHFEYQDNMSTNGSYIKGKRIDRRIALNNYDTLKLGSTELILILVNPEGKEA
jgi:hypothetical protein